MNVSPEKIEFAESPEKIQRTGIRSFVNQNSFRSLHKSFYHSPQRIQLVSDVKASMVGFVMHPTIGLIKETRETIVQTDI